MIKENVHVSVLPQEVFDYLVKNESAPKSPIIFDGTLGGGGHTTAFLQAGATVHASDLDESAIEKVWNKTPQKLQKSLNTGNYNFSEYITMFDNRTFDGILLDLGFSSNQLEFGDRGFSYQKHEEIFDLRYNKEQGEPAWKMIGKLKSEKELGNILYRYGGEYLSSRIGRAIHDMSMKKQGQKMTVGEVVETVINAIPKKFQNKTNATLSRVWQALRIWVNGELDHLARFLPTAINKLKKNGRLAIICFHSLEDKLVTKFMRTAAKSYEVDEFGNRAQDYKLLTPRPIVPTEEEVEQNKRSRSATLRVLEKLV